MEKAINIFNVFPYIELEDYNLRKVNESDYKEIYDIYSDKETVKFEGIEAIKTDTQAKEYIQNILNGYENKYFVRWCVESKKSIFMILETERLLLLDYQLANLDNFLILKSCNEVWSYSTFIPLKEKDQSKQLLDNLINDRINGKYTSMALYKKRYK